MKHNCDRAHRFPVVHLPVGWLLAACALALAAGCSSKTEPRASSLTTGVEKMVATTGSASKGTIGVSVLTLRNPFFKVIGDNIEAELAKHSYKTIVADGADDIEQQRRQVQDFITKKVSAIVLCPVDAVAIGPVIRLANDAGIPVFTADLGCLDPEAQVVSHIATDNLSGGKEAGRAMIEALGDAGGKILILDRKKAESCLLRVQGFKEVIDEHNAARESGKIEIVAELPGEGEENTGFQVTQDALQAHGDIVGIFAINDPSALGARAALEKADKADQVKIVGFDGQIDGKEAIRDGKIYADPIQFPDKIGQLTAQTIVKYFDGEEVPKEQLIPTKLYRKEDAENDPELTQK
ncbi:MAG TPA: substrate-binding domain-containing protein [Pirellulaceae bacterium]|nr:substrate-binding domain-containing protein [Pirellulaceae bacterium]